VRFLIKAGHLATAGWEKLVSLPKNRVQAWRELQSVRQDARAKATAREAARVFEQRFGRSIEDLEKLYAYPHWKHAAAVGGHAWRGVTAVVLALGHAIDAGDPGAAAEQCATLLQAHHNNGPLRRKIIGLDDVVSVVTDAWWRQQHADASS
jgi:hypothetical protein